MARITSRVRGPLLTVGLLIAAMTAFAQRNEPRRAPWRFQEDFSHGIPAWMSYPMAQDVGYDPSLYIAHVKGRAVLERDVIAQGERRLHVGMLRPLQFSANSATRIRLSYDLEAAGPLERVTLTLGARNGKQYTAQLPVRNGPRQFDITGRQLGLTSADADIYIIVMEAIARHPTAGSHNRLLMSGFGVDAFRVPQIKLLSPRLASSATGEEVATEAVTPDSRLTIRTAPESSASTATVFSPDNVRGVSVDVPAGVATAIDFGADASPGLWRVMIANASGRTEFQVLLLRNIPPHPRVLFGADRMEQLKRDSDLQALRENIHRQAVELQKAIAFNPDAGANIALLSPDSVFSGLVPYFTLMDSYANAIGYDALDYRLNGNAQSLDVARRALLTVAAWPTWTPPWFGAHGLHTYYEAGIFTQRVAFGYDLIADQLNAADRQRIADAFLKNEIDPAVQEYFTNERLPIATSNHMAHTVGGALAAVIALAGDVPDWNTRFAPAVAQLLVAYNHLLGDLFPGDGSEAEPASYEDFAMQGLSWGAAALNGLGIHPARRRAMLDAFWWIRYSEVRPDLVLDTGDFDGELKSLSGFAWPAEVFRNPALRQLYDRTDHALNGGSRLKNTGRALETAPTFLDLACCTWSEQTRTVMPPSRIFAGRGGAVLRSGWDENDTVVSLRAGPWFNHEHHDQGSFQVAALGEKLIGEAGYTNYYTDPRYDDYFTQVSGHNTIELDDDPFSQQASDSRFWKSFHNFPRFTGHVFSGKVDYLRANLTNAYDGALKSFTREYLFLKPDVLVTFDRISAPEPHRFTYFLHAPPGARTETDGNHARINGDHASALITATGGSWNAQPAPIPVTAFRDLDRQRVQARSVLRLTTTSNTSATILVGMRFVRNGSSQESLAVHRTANASGFALDANDTHAIALFRTGSGELAAGGVSTDGNILAVTHRSNSSSVFASAARSVRDGDRTTFSASIPVDFVISHNAKAEEVSVAADRAVQVQITSARAITEVTLDCGRISNASGETAVIQVKAGEHIIRLNLQ